jgi:hypothetical protein
MRVLLNIQKLLHHMPTPLETTSKHLLLIEGFPIWYQMYNKGLHDLGDLNTTNKTKYFTLIDRLL